MSGSPTIQRVDGAPRNSSYRDLKQRFGRVAPKWVVRLYRKLAIAVEFWRDYRDYAVSTAWEMGSGRSDQRRDDNEALSSRITIAYHGLEKGASFPAPRRPFGLRKQGELDALLGLARRRDDASTLDVRYAEEALRAVDEFNRTGDISDLVTPRSTWDGRSIETAKIEAFLSGRHSVRDFDPSRRVDINLVSELVRLAGATPSVCNRRAYRAHYYMERGAIDGILALQNGNAGFGHCVPGLFVVTARRSSFVGAGERNQRWIDGGLFAMTLVWSLHASGVGSCFLNWSQTNSQTEKLRSVAGIPESEDVIVLVAVGYPREGHRVARSPKRPVDDIFVSHREDRRHG